MKNAVPNATIIPTMETKSVSSPKVNFIGNDLRKSFSANLDMRMERKTMIEIEDEIIAVAFDKENARNNGCAK
jgi:hypothetical protein